MKIIFSYLLCLLCIIGFSQSEQKSREFYIKGDVAVIGNNSVSQHSVNAINNLDIINDQIVMRFVDVDHDTDTFNSSSSSLNIPKASSQVVFAGLYWSAVYNEKDNLDAITEVLFKTPTSDYASIHGEIVNKGLEKRSEQSPAYLCFADVTRYLATGYNGDYTVANIKASTGEISGGSAAGWVLYVVFKDENASSKYISFKPMFRYLKKEHLEISFNKPPKKNAKSSFVLASLDGDSALQDNSCSIFNSKENKYAILFNEIRRKNNFFNSSITYNDKYVENRNPNSKNTLGFDIAQFDSSFYNTFLADEDPVIKLKISTRGKDNFYIFFSAFETEIDERIYLKNKSEFPDLMIVKAVEHKVEEESTADLKIINVDDVKETLEKTVVFEDENTIKNIKVTTPRTFNKTTPQSKKTNATTLNIASGYYIITNVFSKPHLATNWVNLLKEKGFDPIRFFNPKNHWEYVAVAKFKDLEEAKKAYITARNNPLFVKPWIFHVK